MARRDRPKKYKGDYTPTPIVKIEQDPDGRYAARDLHSGETYARDDTLQRVIANTHLQGMSILPEDHTPTGDNPASRTYEIVQDTGMQRWVLREAAPEGQAPKLPLDWAPTVDDLLQRASDLRIRDNIKPDKAWGGGEDPPPAMPYTRPAPMDPDIPKARMNVTPPEDQPERTAKIVQDNKTNMWMLYRQETDGSSTFLGAADIPDLGTLTRFSQEMGYGMPQIERSPTGKWTAHTKDQLLPDGVAQVTRQGGVWAISSIDGTPAYVFDHRDGVEFFAARNEIELIDTSTKDRGDRLPIDKELTLKDRLAAAERALEGAVAESTFHEQMHRQAKTARERTFAEQSYEAAESKVDVVNAVIQDIKRSIREHGETSTATPYRMQRHEPDPGGKPFQTSARDGLNPYAGTEVRIERRVDPSGDPMRDKYVVVDRSGVVHISSPVTAGIESIRAVAEAQEMNIVSEPGRPEPKRGETSGLPGDPRNRQTDADDQGKGSGRGGLPAGTTGGDEGTPEVRMNVSPPEPGMYLEVNEDHNVAHLYRREEDGTFVSYGGMTADQAEAMERYAQNAGLIDSPDELNRTDYGPLSELKEKGGVLDPRHDDLTGEDYTVVKTPDGRDSLTFRDEAAAIDFAEGNDVDLLSETRMEETRQHLSRLLEEREEESGGLPEHGPAGDPEIVAEASLIAAVGEFNEPEPGSPEATREQLREHKEVLGEELAAQADAGNALDGKSPAEVREILGGPENNARTPTPDEVETLRVQNEQNRAQAEAVLRDPDATPEAKAMAQMAVDQSKVISEFMGDPAQATTQATPGHEGPDNPEPPTASGGDPAEPKPSGGDGGTDAAAADPPKAEEVLKAEATPPVGAQPPAPEGPDGPGERTPPTVDEARARLEAGAALSIDDALVLKAAGIDVPHAQVHSSVSDGFALETPDPLHIAYTDEVLVARLEAGHMLSLEHAAKLTADGHQVPREQIGPCKDPSGSVALDYARVKADVGLPLSNIEHDLLHVDALLKEGKALSAAEARFALHHEIPLDVAQLTPEARLEVSAYAHVFSPEAQVKLEASLAQDRVACAEMLIHPGGAVHVVSCLDSTPFTDDYMAASHAQQVFAEAGIALVARQDHWPQPYEVLGPDKSVVICRDIPSGREAVYAAECGAAPLYVAATEDACLKLAATKGWNVLDVAVAEQRYGFQQREVAEAYAHLPEMERKVLAEADSQLKLTLKMPTVPHGASLDSKHPDYESKSYRQVAKEVKEARAVLADQATLVAANPNSVACREAQTVLKRQACARIGDGKVAKVDMPHASSRPKKQLVKQKVLRATASHPPGGAPQGRQGSNSLPAGYR